MVEWNSAHLGVDSGEPDIVSSSIPIREYSLYFDGHIQLLDGFRLRYLLCGESLPHCLYWIPGRPSPFNVANKEETRLQGGAKGWDVMYSVFSRRRRSTLDQGHRL